MNSCDQSHTLELLLTQDNSVDWQQKPVETYNDFVIDP